MITAMFSAYFIRRKFSEKKKDYKYFGSTIIHSSIIDTH